MKRLINLLKIIGLIGVFILLRLFSYRVTLNNFFVFFITEVLSIFISVFCISFFTDRDKSGLEDRFNASLKASIPVTAAISILTILKFSIPVWLANYAAVFMLGGVIYVREFFIYGKSDSRNFYYCLISASVLVALKLLFNVFNLVSQDVVLNVEFTFISIFILSIFITRAVVFSFFVNGVVEYEGNETYIYESMRVGKSKSCDIVVTDGDKNAKSVYFTVSSKNGSLFVRPAFEMKLDNKIITEKTELQDGDTIKACGNYFTVTGDTGTRVKKIFVLLLGILGSFTAFGEDLEISPRKEPYFADYSGYPTVSMYIPFSNKVNYGDNPEYVFIAEGENGIDYKKTKIEDSFGIDVVFVLDVTGNMPERYKPLRQSIINMYKEINSTGKNLRAGIVTFADEESEQNIYPLTPGRDKFVSYLDSIRGLSGNDYKENPLDSLKAAQIMLNDRSRQRVVIFMTDAPPHVRGDRGKEGVRDFTSLNIEDIKHIYRENNILLLTVSYERFPEYQALISNDKTKFFDIENVDNLGNVIISISGYLSSQVKVNYNSWLRLGSIGDTISVYTGDEAVKQRKDFTIRKLTKRRFFNSLFGIF